MKKITKFLIIFLLLIFLIFTLAILLLFIFYSYPSAEISISGLPSITNIDQIRIKPSKLEINTIYKNPSINPINTESKTPFNPLPTGTITLTPTITITSTATLTPTPTTTVTSTPTFTPTITEILYLDSAYINSIIGQPQLYNLDCEARSAVDFAAYYGVMIDEIDFLTKLPTSNDPELGFVGIYTDPKGQIPPNSYGVHAKPVSDLLNTYGLKTEANKNYTWDNIKLNISQGNPVIAWVISNTYPGIPISYTSSDGNSTTVARYEHTVIVIGYDQNYVKILDGNMIYQRTIDQFLKSWSVLENMVVVKIN